MPQPDDLVGLGMPGTQAAALGNDDVIVVCAGSSAQAGAATIRTTMPELTAASGSANSAIFQSNAPIGTPYYCYCSTATPAVVFPPVGGTLNGTLNGGLTVSQGKTAIFIQYKKNFWASNLTA